MLESGVTKNIENIICRERGRQSETEGGTVRSLEGHLERFGKIWRDLERFGKIWKDFERFGEIWKRFGEIRRDLGRFGEI